MGSDPVIPPEHEPSRDPSPHMAPDRRELVAPEIYLGERGQKLLQPLRRVESLQLVGGYQLAQVSAKERHKVGARTCGWRCARRAACGADAEQSWPSLHVQHTAVTTIYLLLIRSQGMHDYKLVYLAT